MFEDLKQKGNKTASIRSICGLIGSVGLFVIIFFNVFGLEEASIERWKWIVTAVCALAAVAFIVNWQRAASASGMKGIENFCKKTTNPTATMAQLEKTYSEGYDFGSGRMDKEYIIVTFGLSSKVIPLKNAVWAYKKVTQGNGGIFTNLFVCYDKRKYQSAQLNAGYVDAIIKYILENCPDIAVGYEKKLDNFYAKEDVLGFREYARAQRNT